MKQKQPPLSPAHMLSTLLGLSLMLLNSTNVNAELRDINGNTVQTSTADAVQQVCISIATNQDDLNTGSAEETILGQRCGEMVRSARAIQGLSNFSDELGLENETGLLNALLQLAPEETAVMGSGGTDTSHDQMNNIASRLQFLRTGSSTSPITSINFNGSDITGGAAGDNSFSRLGFFLNTNYAFGDKDKSSEEAGFDFDSYGVTTGLDYRINDNLVAGVALGYTESDADLDDNFGTTEAEGYNLSLYGSYYMTNFYIDALIGYGNIDYDSDRNIVYGAAGSAVGTINEKVTSDTEGDQLNWSLGAGYNWAKSGWNTNAFVRLEGLKLDIDSYTEKGSALAMAVNDQDIESLQGIIGTQISFAKSVNFGVMVPYAAIEYHHEFDDDSRTVTAQYTADVRNQAFQFKSDDSDSNFAVATLGLNFVLQQGNQVFINYDTVLGLKDVSSHTFTVGIRAEL